MGVASKGRGALWSLDESLEELAMLTRTAGAEVVAVLRQRLDKGSRTYMGAGKLEELDAIRAEENVSLVICDDELSPNQQRNLETHLDVKIIDRTALILDIFSRHARTREGQLQVELAQHRYILPRLAGQWSHLERLGGGIGTRGPGESQLETDRRLIRKRIQRLERDLDLVRRRRASYMARRKQARLPVVSLVGYTNAGKSTLFNALSKADVTVQNRLFSTLDPVTRRIWLPSGIEILITDTVGFIHKMPPAVSVAFRATLEELQEADLLLHVVDITHPKAPEQSQVVDETLDEMGLGDKPLLLVVNKMDLMTSSADGHQDAGEVPGSLSREATVLVSAAKGWNLDSLLEEIESKLGAMDLLKAPAGTASN